MKRVLVIGLALLTAAMGFLVAPEVTLATPSLATPAASGYLYTNNEAFTWADNYAQGPLDHWYLEISTRPEVDYYPWGFFSGNLVYASGRLTGTPALNLTTIGRTLPAGTYYWHVLGYYGAYGSAGTAWSAVRSFTVRDSTLVAPAIGVTPSSIATAAAQGDTSWHVVNFWVANTGGGTLKFTASMVPASSWAAFDANQYPDNWAVLCRVGFNASGLSPGRYMLNIVVSDNGSTPAATGGSKTVPVTFDVYAADSTAPSGASIKIAGGASATNQDVVTLTLAATDSGSGMGEMCFDNGDGTWSQWIPYSTQKSWHLTAGQGTKTVRARFRDKARNTTGIVSDTIVYDTTAPGKAILSAPTFSTYVSATRSFPVKWLATDSGSGIRDYLVRYHRLPSTTWVTWGGAYKTATSATFTGSAGATYEFAVRARDRAGNLGPWSVFKRTVIPYDQPSAIYSGTWGTYTRSGAYLGSVKGTSSRGAAAALRATGRGYYLLVTVGPGRGKAKVYVDGAYLKTIDTYAATTAYRRLIGIKAFTTAGPHTVRVVNLATAGRPAFQLDGVAVVQ